MLDVYVFAVDLLYDLLFLCVCFYWWLLLVSGFYLLVAGCLEILFWLLVSCSCSIICGLLFFVIRFCGLFVAKFISCLTLGFWFSFMILLGVWLLLILLLIGLWVLC